MTIQIPTALPLNEGIAESEWSLEEPIGEFEPTYAFGPGQVMRYATARWVARLRFENLAQADRHLLAAFAAHVGRHRSFWVYDPSHNKRGSFASTELIVNNGTWTPMADRTVTADTDGVRITRSGVSTTATTGLTTALTVAANAAYAWRGVMLPGAGTTHQFTAKCGSTRTGTEYGSGSLIETGGRFAVLGTPTTSSMYVSVTDTLLESANWTQRAFCVLRRPSVVRSMIVDGGSGSQSQTGSGLYVAEMENSTAGQLKAGDMVEIASATFSQMVRLLEDANGDASGKGYIRFEPMLRKAVINNDLVIPLKPMVKMRLVTDPALITRSGWFSNIEIECRESFV